MTAPQAPLRQSRTATATRRFSEHQHTKRLALSDTARLLPAAIPTQATAGYCRLLPGTAGYCRGYCHRYCRVLAQVLPGTAAGTATRTTWGEHQRTRATVGYGVRVRLGRMPPRCMTTPNPPPPTRLALKNMPIQCRISPSSGKTHHFGGVASYYTLIL